MYILYVYETSLSANYSRGRRNSLCIRVFFLFTFAFKLHAPLLSLGISTGQLSLEIGLGVGLFFQLFTEVVQISLAIAELTGQLLASL